MATNLLQEVRTKLSLPEFVKIDPNVQEGKTELRVKTDHYDQAAVLAVLVGFYKFGSTDNGAREIVNMIATGPGSSASGNAVGRIFGEQAPGVVRNVSRYGNRPEAETQSLLDRIAGATLSVLSTQAGKEPDATAMRVYLAGQRHDILTYLPPDLKMGELVNDSAIEDRTNKMEGPVSNIMHAVEGLFSQKDNTKEI